MQYTLHQQTKVAFDFRSNNSKETLILLHGFCEDSSMWTNFIPLLSPNYNTLVIDLSGFGASHLLPEGGLEAMADVVHTVIEKLYIPHCILIGHSMGGYVGLEFAAKYPQLLKGLGLFHSHPFMDNAEKIKNRQKTMRFVERHGVAPFAGQFVRNLFAPLFVQNNPAFIDALIHHTSSHHSDAVVAASQAMINRKDQSKLLETIQCPVLFIVGKLDKAVAYIDSLKQLALPPISSVHLFEDIAHMGMFERPNACATIINDFLAFCAQ